MFFNKSIQLEHGQSFQIENNDQTAFLTVVKLNSSNQIVFDQPLAALNLASPIPPTSGGTGLTSTTANQLLYSSSNNVIAGLPSAASSVLATDGSSVPSLTQTLPSGVQDNITRTGTITNGVWSGTTIVATKGGTGLATYVQGDLLYASAANTLSALAKSASATRYLSNTGTDNAPAWAQIDLSNGVTGTLTVPNGGLGAATLTDHGILVGSGVAAVDALAVGDTGTVLVGASGADPIFSAAPVVTSIQFGAGSPLTVFTDSAAFTPVPTPAAGAIAVETSLGRWHRVGSLVFIAMKITITDVDTGTGDLTITLPAGLPAAADLSMDQVLSLSYSGVTPDVLAVQVSAKIVSNTKTVKIYNLLSNDVPTILDAENCILEVTGCYLA